MFRQSKLLLTATEVCKTGEVHISHPHEATHLKLRHEDLQVFRITAQSDHVE